MKWKSNAKFNQKETDGTIFDLKEYGIRIAIHKIKGCGNNFYLSCPDLVFSQHNLHTEDFNKAVEMAKSLILKKATKMYNEALKFSEDDSESEFARY